MLLLAFGKSVQFTLSVQSKFIHVLHVCWRTTNYHHPFSSLLYHVHLKLYSWVGNWFLINALWPVFSFRFREKSFNDPKLAQQAEWQFPSVSPFSLSKVSAAACKCHSQWTSWKVTMLEINDYERKNSILYEPIPSKQVSRVMTKSPASEQYALSILVFPFGR